MAQAQRIDWVDYAKGWCIVLVVMMHSTLGVGEAMGGEGWLHRVVAWALPFRMPDFFLVAGLFLSRSIDRDWPTFFDRKVLHFVYFYLLWLLIQSVVKVVPGADMAPLAVAARLGGHLAWSLVEPFGTLWFIYLLPVFFLTTRLLRFVPMPLVLVTAAVLQSAGIHTGSTLVDEFALRYVFFFAGYAFAPRVFALAAFVRERPLPSLAGLLAWGLVNGLFVARGWATLPGISLALGFAGACGVVTFAALLSRGDYLPPLRYAGANSIVVYLAFFLPMAATRVALVRSGLIDDIGTVSAIVTACGIIVPLAFHRVVKDGRLGFLFRRPAFFRLRTRPAASLIAAE